jgi:hypothetical protein
MSITILQQPLDYTPTNAQHAYTAASTLSGATDFRFVYDVWINPRTGPERVARLLCAPNTYGVGIVDVGDIVRNYIKPNPRDDEGQSTGVGASNLTGGTPNGLLINASLNSGSYNSVSFVASNAFNPNINYEELIHVGEYRTLIGEQYTDASGNTITEICEDPSNTPSTIYFGEEDQPAGYSGTPNTINVFDASIGLPAWGIGIPGWSFAHYTTGNTLVASGTTTASTGSYTAALEPGVGDILYITENASGVRYSWQWNVEPGITGWVQGSIYRPPCQNQPDFLTIWPGVQENKTNFNYQNVYWTGNTNGQNNFKYYESEKYRFYINTQIGQDKPAEFLTTFGEELYSATLSNSITTTNVGRIRRRHHHPDCPVLLSYFYRDFNDTALTISGNPTTQFYNYATSWDGNYNLSNITLRQTYTATTTAPEWRIVYDVLRTNVDYGNKIAYWKTTGTPTNSQSLQARISEVVEYYFLDANCMSDPVHFLFLNQRGVWDTWTFDRKNVRTIAKENVVYGSSPIRNSPLYNPFFYSQRDTIYDQTLTEEAFAQTNFMEENDRIIVEELFKSTSVFLIKDYISPVNPQPQYTLTPYLIPIVITNSTFEEYKQRYNKLYQYSLNYRYNPLQLHRSNL